MLAALVIPWRPPTVCLLRAVTGVPCPFCGGTTALVELGRGRPLRALAASPLVALGAPLWAMQPVLERRAGILAALGARAKLACLLAVLAASWGWQLHRLG